ncbi:MAG: glycosyltransferase family 9 protein [Longimicrobiales bacterium]
MADLLRGEQPRSIAIVMLSALGDAVHVLPVANGLRRVWPAARITWLIQPLPHRLVRGHHAIDDFMLFERRRGLSAWRSYTDLRHAFAGRRFDLLLALQVYFKAGIITALAPATVKLGFDRARARDMNWLFTTDRIPPRPVGHVQDQYFEFLEHLGIDPHPIEWRIEFSDDERAAQRAFFATVGRPACAIVVGTSKPEKNWPPERYARVVEAIDANFGLQPLLVGGPAPIERRAATRIRELTRARIIDTLGDDVRRLAWLLDGSRLAISPDTGPLHLARALDTPVIGLYGYSNPKRYGPYRKFTDLIVDGYARYPGEEYAPSMEWRREGMSRVTEEGVLEKVDRALRMYPSS